MYAFFQYSGTIPDWRDFSLTLESAGANDVAFSFSILGVILSGPGTEFSFSLSFLSLAHLILPFQ